MARPAAGESSPRISRTGRAHCGSAATLGTYLRLGAEQRLHEIVEDGDDVVVGGEPRRRVRLPVAGEIGVDAPPSLPAREHRLEAEKLRLVVVERRSVQRQQRTPRPFLASLHVSDLESLHLRPPDEERTVVQSPTAATAPQRRPAACETEGVLGDVVPRVSPWRRLVIRPRAPDSRTTVFRTCPRPWPVYRHSSRRAPTGRL